MLFAEALNKHFKSLLASWRIVSVKEKLDLQKGGVDNSKIMWYREQIIERELGETTNEATLALQSLVIGANTLIGTEA